MFNKEKNLKKKIFAFFMAMAMLLMCGCSATFDVDPVSGAVSVNGVPVEEYMEAAKSMGLLNISVNGINVIGNGTENDAHPDGRADGDIIILHTNDVHCGVDNNMGYAGVAAYKKELEEAGNTVFLVDDGDEIQGGVMGSLTKGEAIIRIMNEVGYELAVPGNHDFDYGVDRFLELAKKADFPYICCNFVDMRTGEPVFESYTIQRIGERRVAFIGAVTPNTISESTPTYFEDENGKQIYGFLRDEDGSSLYDAIQKAVDAAREDSAEYCILMAHLGIDEDDSPFTSREVIANTTGLDAVIDGHSHSIIDGEEVKDKEGKTVLLSQAGYQIPAFGKITIAADGSIKSELIQEYAGRDEEITAAIKMEREAFEDQLDEKIGTVDFDMISSAGDGSVRLARKGETNLGDFVADAYRYATGADIAFINGGGIRANIKAGDITYEDLLNVQPFANELCVREVTGQELLDALEYSVCFAPDEFGGFLQVSGISFNVDTSKDAGVKLDKEGMFAGFDKDRRRVSNVKINGESLDPDKKYKAASIRYILLNKGNGYTMFGGDKEDLDRYLEDITALREYLASMDGKISEDYRDPEGQGRIDFTNK